jgi:SAM-dependent methyltransferase
MGFYQEQLLPRFQDKVMDRKAARDVRARVCAGLYGDVVEIGFGTGLNAPHYPPEVNRVLAVEPSSVCMRIAQPRIAQSPASVETAGLDGQHLDLPAERCDAALSTWTLCTIPDPSVARWQQRLEPLNKRLAGGCHLTREIPETIEQAGFAVEQLRTYYFQGEPKPFSYTFEGRAAKY